MSHLFRQATVTCSARWVNTRSQGEECHDLSVAEIDGHGLCWVHHNIVKQGCATLDEVLTGTREERHAVG
ncbi:MAG: hypothetical protein AMXMBFR56_61930 [Polyangiaceae bacterium]